MSDFKPITTQEEFDDRIAARLKRLQEKHAAELSGYETLQKEHEETVKREASLKAELEELRSKTETNLPEIYKQRLDERTKEIEELRRGWSADRQRLLREKIGYKYGLPEVLIERIHGTTEAEIEEDALLLTELSRKKRTQQPVNMEFRANDPKPYSDSYMGSLKAFITDITNN